MWLVRAYGVGKNQGMKIEKDYDISSYNSVIYWRVSMHIFHQQLMYMAQVWRTINEL
ncbi:hypothetical protein ACIQ7N_21355 [Lysinibacillus sp. NPDC095746]|uniref:hypothetical protein n=1 Tax=Lysinibacillus sp. NPDC095746 TaxID=3364134 RepID=UPI00382DF2C8